MGSGLSMSIEGRHVERDRKTFQNGLAFSNRPIRVQEKIHLRVEQCDQHWQGALRLGFTSRDPSMSEPFFPPALAIPDLTDTDGFWASILPPGFTMLGAELIFWVTHRGVLVCEGPNGVRYRLLNGVDVRRPLWAMIDVYGQTRAVLLLGSEKKASLRHIQRSCPVPPPPPASHGDSCMCVDKGRPCRNSLDYRLSTDCITSTEADTFAEQDSEQCVVCLSARATEVLPCFHRCLCASCVIPFKRVFRNCPLCRHVIRPTGR
ncbi:E3 ubiquitin-protein ligase NEURL3-like isoform X2 [Esox lucius]|nr:E3 ubiquitin-protein ligase NEURL3-like isoform X2 [Esox lucius]